MNKLAYSINETARLLSMGRTSIYAMIAAGRLESHPHADQGGFDPPSGGRAGLSRHARAPGQS